MKHSNLSLLDLKQLDIVDWLEKEGHSPRKIRGNDYWYLSPLRMEQAPSFKVNRKLNAWYDHGMGRGGNLVDLGILYHCCSVKEFLGRMNQNDFSFHQRISPVNDQEKKDADSKINIREVGSIREPVLVDYLDERAIPLDIAEKYCRQLDYEVHGKNYPAIGFKNNSGGFELRNPYFKGSSSPKDSTLIRSEGAASLTVTEGFFDFLSLQAMNQNPEQPPTDYLVLNSLAFIEKNMDRMESYPETNLLLDNDQAGDHATKKLQARSSIFKDRREIFAGYKDLNDWLVKQRELVKQQQQQHTRMTFTDRQQRHGRKVH